MPEPDAVAELKAQLERMNEFNEWLAKAAVTPELARVIAAAIRDVSTDD